jgi:ATP-binding cassette subfamily B protein
MTPMAPPPPGEGRPSSSDEVPAVEKVARSRLAQRDLGLQLVSMWSTTERGWRPLLRIVRGAVRLARAASPRRLLVLVALSVAATSGLTGQILAGRSLFQQVLVAPGLTASLITPLVVLAVLTAAVKLAMSATQHLSMALNLRMQQEAEGEVLTVAARMPLEAYDDQSFHENLQRASVSVSHNNSLVTTLVGVVGGLLSVVAMSSLLLALSPVLVPLMVAATGFELWLGARSSRDLHETQLGLIQLDLRTRAFRGAVMHRQHLQDVHAYDLLDHLEDCRLEAEFEQAAAQAAASARTLRRDLLGNAVAGVAGALTVLVLILAYRHGDVGLPSAAAAALAYAQGRRWLRGVGDSLGGVYRSSVLLTAYDAFLRLGRAMDAERPTTVVPGPFERLELEQVSFCYPGATRPALDGVLLTLGRGEVVALVGENGSGKTTLAKVIASLFTPTSGRVRWDGLDLADCDPASAREHIAVIFQDFARYRMTARDNIGLGRVDALGDAERLEEAARQAGIHEVLAGLSHGYDTYLTQEIEPGGELSGGQWQRVALARAFFRDAGLLILDEPTSALDARAEQALFERIRQLAAGRTVLLISHRFSTVRSADRIVVLHEGRVTEQGSHGELMAQHGRYSELFTIQAAAYQPVPTSVARLAQIPVQPAPVAGGQPAGAPALPPPADPPDVEDDHHHPAGGCDAPEPDPHPAARPDRDVVEDYLSSLDAMPPWGWRRLPGLAWASLRLCRDAAPRRFAVLLVCAVVGAGCLAAQVQLGRHALATLLSTRDAPQLAAGLVASLLLLAAFTALSRLTTAAQSHQTRALGDYVLFFAEGPVLRVGGSVPLEIHEDSRYFKRQNEAEYALLNSITQLPAGSGQLVAGVVGVVAVSALLVTLAPWLLLLLLASSAAQLWAGYRSAGDYRVAQSALTQCRLKMDGLRELLLTRENAQEAHAYNLHRPLIGRWRDLSEGNIRTWLRFFGRANRRQLAADAVGTAFLGVGVLVLVVQFVHGQIGLPAALAALFAFQQGGSRLRTVGVAAGLLMRCASAHDAYDAFLQLGEVMARQPKRPAPPAACGTLSVDNIGFTYPTASRPALQEVEATITAGQVVAVVGENGSGKTTLAKLLAHLYAPTVGAIRWDGVDTAHYDQKRARAQVAVMFQDFTLFELPVATNIGFGDLAHLTEMPRVREAAAAVGLHETIEALPSGYQTVVSRRMGDGVDLSGGQRQRLALARAFFRHPLLLILDEPSSALDAKAEKQLFDHVRRVAADRTVVFVSHRFTTVRNADHIIVMHEGRVAEQGSHEQLMANGGRYKELFDLQAAPYLTGEQAATGVGAVAPVVNEATTPGDG